MTPAACLHCGVAPERRQQASTGLVMWICPVCSNRGEATTSEARALSSWHLVNDADMPAHDCKGAGVPRFFVQRGQWGARCPACDYVDHGFGSIEGARAAWVRSMR